MTGCEMRMSDWSSDVCSSDLLQVAAQRVDFLVGQRLGDLGHDVEQVRIAFAGGAGAVFLQAMDHVVRLLAADVRVGRARVAGAGGAMAGHAGRDSALGVAAAEQLRSEEHTSELQSLMRISYAVFCLNKKKTPPKYTT